MDPHACDDRRLLSACANRAALRAALREANVPTLLMVHTQLTHDEGFLEKFAPHLRSPFPAFVASAELDPTRDDCEAYAARLAGAGVATECRRYPGAPHGFASWVGLADVAQRALDDACRFVAKHAGEVGR